MNEAPAPLPGPGSPDDRSAGAELLESLLRPARISIPLAGAGVAQSAGLPGSAEIARHLIDHFDLGAEYPTDPAPLSRILDETLYARGVDAEVSEVVREYVRSWPQGTSTLIENLSRVHSRFVVTFNYEPSIERAAERRHEPVESLGNGPADLERALKILGGEEPLEALTVVHLHGRAEGPEELVLNAGSYRRAESTMKTNLLRELVLQKHLFFFGTTLNEVELLDLFQKTSIPSRRNAHLFFCFEEERSLLTEGRAPIVPARSNIYVNGVESHDELAHYAARLVDADPPAARVAISVVEFDPAHYVPNRLHDRRGPDPEDPATIAAAISAGEDQVVPAIPEDELLSAPRSVVLGEPGTGKTEMLRRLASAVRAPRRAVLIRLADVTLKERVGLKETLRAWAREGSAFQDEAEFEVAALDQQPFHFFLDGLDEVASDLQQDFAARISECATALPQHSFTLASRPLPSLELLRVEGPVASDWEQLVLRPDENWRAGYLAASEVTLEQLYEQMPALEDLSEVTTTPFYLARIVSLAAEGRLKGLSDFSALLRTLLNAAIAHEGEALEIDDEAARAWLREVALAGAIAGRRTFAVGELGRFALPSGVGAERLARGLEQRLLLAEDSSSFRFHHRLLGEQLAAEALVERGPLPELCDALVPLVDRELSGVRPDCAVPVALAALRSPEWRAALAERDPLAAARATPDGAPRAEIEVALRALWSNAVETQVWVWERGMQLVDDADSMGRLLKAAPGCPLEEVLLKAARGEGSDQDRGNAIRVLARAQHPELEPILLEVLQLHGQNGVVLRQAAIAAEDRGFDGLIWPLVEMLKREHDNLVHQVGVHVLSRLAPSERLLEVFSELLEGSEASYAVVVVLPELDDGEALRLIARYLAHGEDARDLTGRRRIEAIFARLDFASLGREELVAAIDVALGLQIGSEQLAEIAVREPELAVERLVELVGQREFDWWEVIDLAEHFEPERLREAGAPEVLVERAAQLRLARGAQAKLVTEQGESALLDPIERAPAEEAERPGLAALLSRPGTDAELQRRSEVLAAEIEELGETERAELLSRMEAWWPDKPFAETITHQNPHQWSQEWPASAWLRYGPKARPVLAARRWAELATCGVLWDKHTKWLREAYTSAGAYAALPLLAGEDRPERWDQFLSCCEDPPPNPVLIVLAERLDTRLPKEERNQRYHLRSLARRMLDNGRDDLARQLAAGSEHFAAMLGPLLAGGGDVENQLKLAAELSRTLQESGAPGPEDLDWLSGVDSERLLGALFAILEQNWKLDERPVAMVRSGYGLSDLFNPLQEAIARVGGRGAVAGYDRLLSRGGDFRWLRGSRARIAAAVLLADGQRYGPGAARALGLPVLDPDAGADA
ncbi:MAG TPA: SIR2 family protein [Solirubrobacterales bacterium]|jgi:hypothetical protein